MKKLIEPFLGIAIFLLVFTACKKDEESHPEVETTAIEPLSPTKVILKGNIIDKGSFDVVDYGFIYSHTSYLTESSGIKVSLGSSAREGTFSKEIQNIPFNSMLYARAYLANANGTVYGPVVSKRLPTVTAGSLSPTSGKPGDLITINGQFANLDKGEVSVTFGGVSTTVEEISSTKIIVKVPSGISTSYYSSNQVQVHVKIGNQNINSSSNYFTLDPAIKDFWPKTGQVGTAITITGDHIFSYGYNQSFKVYFGQMLVSHSVGTNGITVTVPGTISTATFPISVEYNGKKTTLAGEFTLTPHTISSISPATGIPGSSFSIFGSNFPGNSYYYNSTLSVTIGAIPASANWVSSGQLNVTIPSNLPAGDYKVAVKSGPFNIEASQLLKVQALTVSSFSPTSGGVGKEITLQGIFAPNQSYQVYFGSVSTYVSTASSTTIKAAVPFGATPGTVKISVKYNNQSAEASGDFTVLAPVITSFSPTSGVAGTVVTISGTGFSTYSSVKFGTVQTSVISATENTIKAVVPSNLTLGAMKISVVSNGQTIVSSDNFTVTN